MGYGAERDGYARTWHAAYAMNLLSVAELNLSFPPDMKADVEGWNSRHPLFAKLIAQTKPKTIFEIGSWKGASALHMAELTADLDTHIYCIDTWLGDPNPEQPNCLNYDVGAIYRQFCFNASLSPAAARIHPVPQTSDGAARILFAAGLSCNLCYVDGRHDYEGVFADITAYSALIAPGGTMFGDDWEYQSVRMAVTRFAYENNLRVGTSGPAWTFLGLNTNKT